MRGRMLWRNITAAACLPALFLACAAGPARAADAAPDNRAAFEMREQLLGLFRGEGARAVPALAAALDHESQLVSRTAAHLLARLGAPARGGLEKALRHPDFQVRRIAMYGLEEMGFFPEYWPVFLQDAHPSIRREIQLYFLPKYPLPEGAAFETIVGRLAAGYPGAETPARRHVVETVAALTPLTGEGRKLLVRAAADEDAGIRETAFQAILKHIALDWPEGEALLAAADRDESKAIRDIGFDLRVKLLLVREFVLPAGGWRFRTDPADAGRDAGWFRPDFNDADWRPDGKIETAWMAFLGEQYIGPGWYRQTVEVPAVAGWDAALLHFGGVDEQGWAWLDGHYLGGHDIGASGWDVPFMFDITGTVKPGRQQFTIRAQNSAGNGGVWRPARLLFLRNWPR